MVKTVTTTIREDEVDQIDMLWPGYSRAQNMRVLLRYALEHKTEVYDWLNATNDGAYEVER